MDLRKYDSDCVRITLHDGEIVEGYCSHNGREYNFHEYGRDEDSLQILNFQFYESDIREVKSLEDCNGPYGRFSSSYGRLEELTAEDGIDSIEEVLESEETEHVYRLLLCLNDRETIGSGDELKDLLLKRIESESDERILAEAKKLLWKISGGMNDD